MVTILALIFTFVVGTLIWTAVKAKYFYTSNSQTLWYYLACLFTYVLTYYVGRFVATILWTTTLIMFNVVLVIVVIAAIAFGSYWLYSKITGKPMNWPPKSTHAKDGAVVKEAQVIEVVDKD